MVNSVDASLGPRKWTHVTAFLAHHAPGTTNPSVLATRSAGHNPLTVHRRLPLNSAP